jgi:hypothetical protein
MGPAHPLRWPCRRRLAAQQLQQDLLVPRALTDQIGKHLNRPSTPPQPWQSLVVDGHGRQVSFHTGAATWIQTEVSCGHPAERQAIWLYIHTPGAYCQTEQTAKP